MPITVKRQNRKRKALITLSRRILLFFPLTQMYLETRTFRTHTQLKMNEAASGGVTVIRDFSRSRGFVSNMPPLFLLFLLFHFRVRGEHTVFIWLGNHK